MHLEDPKHHELFRFCTVLHIVGRRGPFLTITFLLLTTEEIHILTLYIHSQVKR